VDTVADFPTAEAVVFGIEIRSGNVLELETTSPEVKPAKSCRFAPAQRALAVNQQRNLVSW
jgi:hypothetical protein